MVVISLLVTAWPLTPNVRIVYPLRGAEVSQFEKIAGSFAQLPVEKDMWVNVVTDERDKDYNLCNNNYFSSIDVHRDEGTWETRDKVGFGRKPGAEIGRAHV